MEQKPNIESAWARGWQDTKAGWADWRFWVCEVFGGGLVAYFIDPALGLVFVATIAAAVWFGATVSAPIKQRNDERRKHHKAEMKLAKHIGQKSRDRTERLKDAAASLLCETETIHSSLRFKLYPTGAASAVDIIAINGIGQITPHAPRKPSDMEIAWKNARNEFSKVSKSLIENSTVYDLSNDFVEDCNLVYDDALNNRLGREQYINATKTAKALMEAL